MPFVPQTPSEKIMFAVRRIEALSQSAQWVGTGFCYNVQLSDSSVCPILITNRHVVEGAEAFRVLFHTAESAVPDGGKVNFRFDGTNSRVWYHPDERIDLAAIAVAAAFQPGSLPDAGKQIYWAPFTKDLHPKEEIICNMDACEPITMVGCPSGLWDEENGFPIFRRGVTATHYSVDFNGRPEFAIDVGVYSGSSGSPVVLLDQGLYKPVKTDNTLNAGTRCILLGVLWGGPRITEDGEMVIEPIPDSKRVGIRTPVRMHLGYAIKSQEILRLAELITSA